MTKDEVTQKQLFDELRGIESRLGSKIDNICESFATKEELAAVDDKVKGLWGIARWIGLGVGGVLLTYFAQVWLSHPWKP